MAGRRSDAGAVDGRALGKSLIGWGALFALVAAQPVAVSAQTTNPTTDRTTPYGSPLDAAVAGSTAATQTTPSANLNAAQSSTSRIEPVMVGQNDRDQDNNGSNTNANERNSQSGSKNAMSSENEPTKKPAPPSEFEKYAERVLGRKLPRFGADLLVPASRDFARPATAAVPPSYLLNVGDEVTIGMTGSIEGTVSAEIDPNGRIFLPRVGPVRLVGVRYGDLQREISRAIGQQFRDFRVTATVTKLRGIRVYVTGFANNPGAYTVTSLSTLVNAVLAAGGPSAGGSFRSVKLYRAGRLVTDFDLYDLLRNGDKSHDAVLENEDVLFIPPVGEQIAIAGSVNAEAIYEAKPRETLETLLRYAGGTNALADASRVMLYRVSNLDTIGGQEVSRAQTAATLAEAGDIVQVLSVGTLARPLERQSVLVRIEGEVLHPGNYYVQPGSNMDQVVALAGGLTQRAFVYGSRLERVSVREQQRASFEDAVRQLEISLAAAPLTGDQTIDTGTRGTQVASAQAVLNRLRQAEPDGRVVMSLAPDANALPGALVLENNDRIFVPPRSTTVGVFGAVYRPASFLMEGGKPLKVDHYLQMAGGPLRVADKSEIFVVRANGSVLSRHSGALSAYVLPGDVIFVPVRTERSSVFAKLLQISTLIFQLGLSAATVVAVTN